MAVNTLCNTAIEAYIFLRVTGAGDAGDAVGTCFRAAAPPLDAFCCGRDGLVAGDDTGDGTISLARVRRVDVAALAAGLIGDDTCRLSLFASSSDSSGAVSARRVARLHKTIVTIYWTCRLQLNCQLTANKLLTLTGKHTLASNYSASTQDEEVAKVVVVPTSWVLRLL